MNSISNNNNVNFTAKLNITNVANKNRWANIGKHFEKITSDFPNDELIISGSLKHNDNIGIDLYDHQNKYTGESALTSDATKKLSKLKNSEIAQKLKTVLKALKLEEELFDIEIKLSKKHKFNKRLTSKTEDKIVDAFSDVITELQQKELNSDSLLKDGMLFI